MVYTKGGVRLWACLAGVNKDYRDAMDEQLEVAKRAEPRMYRLVEDTIQCDAKLDASMLLRRCCPRPPAQPAGRLDFERSFDCRDRSVWYAQAHRSARRYRKAVFACCKAA